MQQRAAHYMPSSLLQSQFDALEEPKNALVEDISQTPEAIAENIIKALD
jgi:gluconate kinase